MLKNQACGLLLMSSINLCKSHDFFQLRPEPDVLQVASLDSAASFGDAPQRDELKAMLDRIKINGTDDRINLRRLPFRVD
jgi:hypothetical protein